MEVSTPLLDSSLGGYSRIGVAVRHLQLCKPHMPFLRDKKYGPFHTGSSSWDWPTLSGRLRP